MITFTEEMKTSGFEQMPEGVTVLRVESVKAVQSMGKVQEYKARFKDAKGRIVFNDYKTKYSGAMRSFYMMLTKGCGLTENADGQINEEDAVGKYLIARINHTQGNDDRIFVNLGYILGPADSFNTDISDFTGESKSDDFEVVDDFDPYA